MSGYSRLLCAGVMVLTWALSVWAQSGDSHSIASPALIGSVSSVANTNEGAPYTQFVLYTGFSVFK